MVPVISFAMMPICDRERCEKTRKPDTMSLACDLVKMMQVFVGYNIYNIKLLAAAST